MTRNFRQSYSRKILFREIRMKHLVYLWREKLRRIGRIDISRHVCLFLAKLSGMHWSLFSRSTFKIIGPANCDTHPRKALSRTIDFRKWHWLHIPLSIGFCGFLIEKKRVFVFNQVSRFCWQEIVATRVYSAISDPACLYFSCHFLQLSRAR